MTRRRGPHQETAVVSRTPSRSPTGRASGTAVYRPVGSTMNPIRWDPSVSSAATATTSRMCSPLASRLPGKAPTNGRRPRLQAGPGSLVDAVPDGPDAAFGPGAHDHPVGAADDVPRAGRQEPLARVRHQHDGAAVLDRTVGRRQVVAAEVEQRVSRRSPFRVADRPRGDRDVPAVVGDLPVMRVPADDRLDPSGLDDRSPLVDARPVEILPDLVRVVVLEDHHALASASAESTSPRNQSICSAESPTGRDSWVLSRMNLNPRNEIAP